MSLHTLIKRNEYHDSVVLMNASTRLREAEGVLDALIVMGTEANKDVLRDLGLLNEESQAAGSDDLIVALKAADEAAGMAAINNLDTYFVQAGTTRDEEQTFPTLQSAFEAHPDATLALISIPGEFAAREAVKAMDMGLHTLLFSANVSLDEEVKLKAMAEKQNVLMMGPDCGVCNINGAALALASIVGSGPVGIVGASGSGLQEISAIVSGNGLGVSQAIGAGGRDMKPQVQAATTIRGIQALDADSNTRVIVALVKPAPAHVTETVCQAIHAARKPVVVCCLGEKPDKWLQAGALYADTMDGAARLAVALIKGESLSLRPFELPDADVVYLAKDYRVRIRPSGRYVRGVYGAGTFVGQAQMIMNQMGLPVYSNTPFGHGKPLEDIGTSVDNTLIDLGDEELTRGRAHPVIDPLPYRIRLKKEFSDPDVAVVLLDVILGPACYPDPAGYLLAALDEAGFGPESGVVVVASVCGTDGDPQVASQQRAKLRQAGVIVMPSSAQATRFAALLVYPGQVEEGLNELYVQMPAAPGFEVKSLPEILDGKPVFPGQLKVINVGIDSMAQAIKEQGFPVVQVDWQPPAGGNIQIIELLDALNTRPDLVDKVQAANRKVYDIFVNGQPVWVDVAPAGEVVPGFRKNLVLYTGPPIKTGDMIGAHRDGVIGGILFEGLAKTREEALHLIETGEVEICPGIDWGVPSGGMAPTTYSMPVVVAKDLETGTMGFCPIQEGPSYEALRWGVYNDVVAERWQWFRNSFGPALSAALKRCGGVSLKNVVARSLQMGDENHSRETGSTLLMTVELAPHLSRLGLPGDELARIFDFLREAERFALHVHIAGAFSVLRAAANIPYSSVMVAMGGNGVEIGIKISGLDGRWFTAPAPYIKGRYLNPNWTPEDTVPYAGDSCAVEVYGLGGLAAAASPAVTLLAGGSVQDALRRTQDMWTISVGKNTNYAIPALNFEGTPAAIDMLKVLEGGMLPQSHAGIILRQGGQAGAGVAHVPMLCFESAFLAFAEEIGLS